MCSYPAFGGYELWTEVSMHWATFLVYYHSFFCIPCWWRGEGGDRNRHPDYVGRTSSLWQVPEKTYLGKERFIPAHGFRGSIPSWRRWPSKAPPIMEDKKQTDRMPVAAVFLFLPLLFHPDSQSALMKVSWILSVRALTDTVRGVPSSSLRQSSVQIAWHSRFTTTSLCQQHGSVERWILRWEGEEAKHQDLPQEAWLRLSSLVVPSAETRCSVAWLSHWRKWCRPRLVSLHEPTSCQHRLRCRTL